MIAFKKYMTQYYSTSSGALYSLNCNPFECQKVYKTTFSRYQVYPLTQPQDVYTATPRRIHINYCFRSNQSSCLEETMYEDQTVYENEIPYTIYRIMKKKGKPVFITLLVPKKKKLM